MPAPSPMPTQSQKSRLNIALLDLVPGPEPLQGSRRPRAERQRLDDRVRESEVGEPGRRVDRARDGLRTLEEAVDALQVGVGLPNSALDVGDEGKGLPAQLFDRQL